MPNISLKINEHPIFDKVSEKRTVLGDETEKSLLIVKELHKEIYYHKNKMS